jgi:hypothetical protein
MKKMIVAAGLALALTASSHQQASAWCKLNFSAGVNLSYESTGCNFSSGGFGWQPNPSPYGCANFYPPAPYLGYNQPSYGPAPAYGYSQPAAPVAPAAPAAAAAPVRTQQVGYYFYSQGYAPSYWYGN